MRLTARDDEILDTLANRIRVMSISQIARTWWSESPNKERNAISRIKALSKGGYLELHSKLARVQFELTKPEIAYTPGDSTPELGGAAWRFRTRWERARITPTQVVWATEQARRERGGAIRPPRNAELSHDLMLSSILAWYQEHHPELATHWVHEDELREVAYKNGKRGEVPDALIWPDWTVPPVLTIECAGAYRKEKLLEFHNANSSTPYVIW